MEQENRVKVKFIYYNLENELETESVWADKEEQFYRIKNIPFFAPNIAYDDLISVEDDDDELFYDELIQESGNSTIQIIVFKENDVKSITKQLEQFGCGWEGSHLKTYISVNVPKNIEYQVVKSYLDSLESEHIISYKEACLAHKN